MRNDDVYSLIGAAETGGAAGFGGIVLGADTTGAETGVFGGITTGTGAGVGAIETGDVWMGLTGEGEAGTVVGTTGRKGI